MIRASRFYALNIQLSSPLISALLAPSSSLTLLCRLAHTLLMLLVPLLCPLRVLLQSRNTVLRPVGTGVGRRGSKVSSKQTFFLVLSTLMLPLETLVTVSGRFRTTALGALRVSWFGVVRVLRGHLGRVRVFSLVVDRHVTCYRTCLSDLYLARVPVRVVLFGVVLSQVASNAPRAVLPVGMLVVISQRAAFTVCCRRDRLSVPHPDHPKDCMDDAHTHSSVHV